MVGLFIPASGVSSGFILKGGQVTVVNFPDPTSTGTNLEGINDKGEMSGSYSDANGNSHSFILSADMTTFDVLNIPGSLDNQAWAINKSGEVAVSSDIGSFIYCSKNGAGHCKNVPNALVVQPKSVRAITQTFNCVNGCKPASVMAALRTQSMRLSATSNTLRQKPYKRPQ